MATKLMQIKQDEGGNVTCTLSKFDDAGAREGEPEAVDSPPPRVLSEFFPLPQVTNGSDAVTDDDPDTARFLDETHNADDEQPVAQSSDDYVKTELKKYQNSKPKPKPQAAKGKTKH